jgi:hypothetical protein
LLVARVIAGFRATNNEQRPTNNQTLPHMEFMHELWLFFRTRKKYWLIPLLFFLVLLGALTVVTGGSALAPFIYSLF